MTMCQPHWDELRAAVKAAGLEHTVSPDGVIAAQRAVKMMKGSTDPADFDALIYCFNVISLNALRGNNREKFLAGYQGCPLCLMGGHCVDCFAKTRPGNTEWIGFAVRDCLAEVADLQYPSRPESVT
jgi:hypothetical protein